MRREVGWGWRGWGGQGGYLQQQGQPQGHLGERTNGTWPNQGEILAGVVATVSIDNMKSLTMKTFIQKFLDVENNKVTVPVSMFQYYQLW